MWAERYAPRNENLAYYAPFTSKDLDYFGTRETARKIAERVEGRLETPDRDHQTPVTAALITELEGDELIVQFIDHVLGAVDKDVKKRVAIIAVPMVRDGVEVDVAISIMHPIHCLASRAANVIKLGRTGEIAMRQLNASVYVLQEFVEDLLVHGEHGKASQILRLLYRYIRSKEYGRDIHTIVDYDPLKILIHFSEDERFDDRFRPHLKIWAQEVQGRRANREERIRILQRRSRL